MKSTFLLIVTLSLTLGFAWAQQAWEYALMIVASDGYTFDAPDAAADGVDAADFYFNLTGEELPRGTPAVSILSALGGSGWELVTVDNSDDQIATYYFKRAY